MTRDERKDCWLRALGCFTIANIIYPTWMFWISPIIPEHIEPVLLSFIIGWWLAKGLVDSINKRQREN